MHPNSSVNYLKDVIIYESEINDTNDKNTWLLNPVLEGNVWSQAVYKN